MVGKAALINNTCQQIIDKAQQELTNYDEGDNEDWGAPNPYIHEPYPMRMNHREGTASPKPTITRTASASQRNHTTTPKAS